MKAILLTGALSCAGLAYLGQLAPKIGTALNPPEDPEAFRRGLDVVTGRYLAEGLKELEAIPAPAMPTGPLPATHVPELISDRQIDRPAVLQPQIVAAWGDESGRVFVRLASGQTCRRLESGALITISHNRKAQ